VSNYFDEAAEVGGLFRKRKKPECKDGGSGGSNQVTQKKRNFEGDGRIGGKEKGGTKRKKGDPVDGTVKPSSLTKKKHCCHPNGITSWPLLA
jgi:hypothetical protein